MHLLLAVLLTLGMAVGLTGLGDLLGGTTAGDRWVRGWTLSWWSVAVSAQVSGPRFGVAVGVAVLAVGAARAAWTLRAGWRAGLALAAAILAGAWLWLAPPFFYDALVYHLGLPWTWLVNGSFQPIRHDLFSRFPLAGETIYLVPVSLGLPAAAAGLHWATFVVALATAAGLARRLGAGRVSWVAPVLLLACWHAVFLAGQANVDHLVTVGVLVAGEHLTADDWPARRRVVGAALGLALAASSKYTAAPIVAAVLVAAAVVWPRRLRATAAAAGLAAVFSSFWWARNLLQTGNPVFPLLWRWLGGRGWTERDDGRFLALTREGVGGLGDALHGFVKVLVPPDGLGWWVVVAIPLASVPLLVRSDRRRTAAWTGLTVLLALAGWLATSQTTRYALPGATFLGVLAAAGLGAMDRKLRPWAGAMLAIPVVLGLVNLATLCTGTLQLDRLWLGNESADAWRHRVTVDDPLPGYRACARLLPASARVLVVGEGRPFGCPRPHHVSSPYDTQEAQELVEASSSPAELQARLCALGWTHLFVSDGELRRLGGTDYRVLRFEKPADADRWRRFLHEFTSVVWQADGLTLRAIRPPPEVPTPRPGQLPSRHDRGPGPVG